MAQNLQLLKRRIKTSKNISQIAKALEMIAASKIKKAQHAALSHKPYSRKVKSLTESIIRDVDLKKYTHPYLNSDNTNKLLIAISPDRGLCGSLNTNIYKKMLEISNDSYNVITIGKKVGIFSSKIKVDLISSYPMGNTLPDYTKVYQIKTEIDSLINSGQISQVDILYADFVSLFTQVPKIEKLLPLNINSEDSQYHQNSTLFEPNRESLLSELLPYYLETQLYSALLTAFTSEQAAQMMAMQNAKNNARDIAEYLNLVYNKSRQERITNEILDLANSIQI